MSDSFDPTPDDRFTFGLWTVGNPGADPFGPRVRPSISPTEIVAGLAKVGAYGVNLHDNDLVPFGASAAERDRIVADFKQACEDHGLAVPMATTNLFSHPVFRDGAFTSSNPKVRAYAIQKVMRSIETGIELGAKINVFWGGREGLETDAAKDTRDAIKWYRECLDFLCAWTKDQGWEQKFALEAKPNEPPKEQKVQAFAASSDEEEGEAEAVQGNDRVRWWLPECTFFSHAFLYFWHRF